MNVALPQASSTLPWVMLPDVDRSRPAPRKQRYTRFAGCSAALTQGETLAVDEETREHVLVGASGEEVRFCVDVRVRHSFRGREHTYMLPELGLRAKGRSAEEAMDNLVKEVRRAISRYLTTFADLLTPPELSQKQLLLAWVDVAGSGLLPGVRPFTWVLGSLEPANDG